MKEWIRLFQINDRSCLEEQLNRFINQNDVTDIKVWTDCNGWYAQVRYRFKESPPYSKPDFSEESSTSSE